MIEVLKFVAGACFIAVLAIVVTAVTVRQAVFGYMVARRRAERYLQEEEELNHGEEERPRTA